MKNKYEIRGDVTAIFLFPKNGEVIETIIDTADLELVNSFPNTWYAHWSKFTESYYVHGNKPKDNNGKRGTVAMHRYLVNPSGEKHVDHKNNNTLDNRRSVNLREVTFAENMQNVRGPYKNNKCGIKGVYWEVKARKWKAQINTNGKVRFLGYYETKEEAGEVAAWARAEMMPYSKEANC